MNIEIKQIVAVAAIASSFFPLDSTMNMKSKEFHLVPMQILPIVPTSLPLILRPRKFSLSISKITSKYLSRRLY